MIQVTFQFTTIEQAVATLGTLLQRGAPVPNVDKPAVEPVVKSNRKPRADAGKARGPYKNVEAPVTAGADGIPPIMQGQAGASTPETAAPETASNEGQAIGGAAVAPNTPDAAAPGLTPKEAAKAIKDAAANKEDNVYRETLQAARDAVPDEKAVQAALDKVFAAKGMKPTMALLAEFGVAKGRDLKPEQRAAFIAKAEELTK